MGAKTTRAKTKSTTKRVKILLPPAGSYFLSASVGDVIRLPAAQADELVEDKYAKFVK